MSLYQILTLFSVPSIIISIIVVSYRRNKAMRLGMQALLRAELVRDWSKYREKGFAPIYEKENFENVYQQYHNLGANGVMDDIREKFLNLPDKLSKEDDHDNKA